MQLLVATVLACVVFVLAAPIASGHVDRRRAGEVKSRARRQVMSPMRSLLALRAMPMTLGHNMAFRAGAMGAPGQFGGAGMSAFPTSFSRFMDQTGGRGTDAMFSRDGGSMGSMMQGNGLRQGGQFGMWGNRNEVMQPAGGGLFGGMGRGMMGPGAFGLAPMGSSAMGLGSMGAGGMGFGSMGAGGMGLGSMGAGGMGFGSMGSSGRGFMGMGPGGMGQASMTRGAMGPSSMGSRMLGSGAVGSFGAAGNQGSTQVVGNTATMMHSPLGLNMGMNSPQFGLQMGFGGQMLG